MKVKRTVILQEGSTIDKDEECYSSELTPESLQDEIELLGLKIDAKHCDAANKVKDIIEAVEKETGQKFIHYRPATGHNRRAALESAEIEEKCKLLMRSAENHNFWRNLIPNNH